MNCCVYHANIHSCPLGLMVGTQQCVVQHIHATPLIPLFPFSKLQLPNLYLILPNIITVNEHTAYYTYYRSPSKHVLTHEYTV